MTFSGNRQVLLLLRIQVPVLGRRHLMPFLEGPHEVLRIFVADHFADLVDCQSGTLKEQVGFLETDLFKQLGKGAAEEFFDIAGAVGNGIVQMSGQLLQSDGGVVLLYVKQDLMVAVAKRNGLCGCLPVSGEAQQQNHQHTGQYTIRIVVRGEHLAEHMKDLLTDLLVIPGAEEQILFTVFIIDAAKQEPAEHVLPLEKPGTDFREGGQAYQNPDTVAFGRSALRVSGRRRQDTEISCGESLHGLVDHMDAAAGKDVDDLEISMGMFRNLNRGRLKQDYGPFHIGGDVIDIIDDIQDMIPGEQWNSVRIVVHRHF